MSNSDSDVYTSSDEERFRRRSRRDELQENFVNESPNNNEQNEEPQNEEQRVEEEHQDLDDTCAQMVPLETLKQNYNEALQPLVYAMKEMTQSVKNLQQGESHRRRKRNSSSSESSSRSRSRSYRRKRKRHTSLSSRSRSFERSRSHDRRSKDKSLTDEEIEDVFEGEEKTGKDLRRETKYITDTYFSKKLTYDSIQQRMKKHPRPGNCNKLKTPKTNDEVWSKLKVPEKSMDLKIKNTQKMLMASTTALAKGIDKKCEINSLFEDGLVLLGQAHLQLSAIRKDLHRKNLSYSLKELQELENNEDFLYGDDGKLKKKIKELEREAKEEKKKPFLGQYQKRRNFYQNQNYKKYSSHYQKQTTQRKSYQNQKQRKKFQA